MFLYLSINLDTVILSGVDVARSAKSTPSKDL